MKIIAVTAVAAIVLAAAPGFAQSTPDSTKQPTQSLSHADISKQPAQSLSHSDASKQAAQSSEPSRGHQAGHAEPEPR